MGSHLQEQRRAASERPKAIHSIRRARSGYWRSGTSRRLTPAQPAGAPLANAIALTGSPRPTGSPSMLPPGGGGGPSYAARRALRRSRLCVPTNGTLRSPRARRRSGLTRVAWRTDTAVFCTLLPSILYFSRITLRLSDIMETESQSNIVGINEHHLGRPRVHMYFTVCKCKCKTVCTIVRYHTRAAPRQRATHVRGTLARVVITPVAGSACRAETAVHKQLFST